MYQIVLTSEFIRDLAESTHAVPRCAGPTAGCDAEPAPARRAPAAAARAGVAHLALGRALRLLGAH